MVMLPITLTIAGAAALLNLWLGLRVSLLRRRLKVSIGDGGNEPIARRMRGHANFTEYAPFVLILLGLVEYTAGSSPWLWAAGILFIVGRLAHPFGMDRPGASALRIGGMAVTWAVLLALAAWSLTLPYAQRPPEPAVTYAAKDQPRAST